ncbi:uncharacterized protein V1518DRAFT_417406 [Limtongia smithiae]|uniref:uncharacterized protein n=1 Tax=Limtongia smithiae TaxID=1125753 RepID=UPI0034CFC16A
MRSHMASDGLDDDAARSHAPKRQRIAFVRAQEQQPAITAPAQSQGKRVASFYASLVGVNSTPAATPAATVPATSISSQLDREHLEPPVALLPVPKESAGHRYLVRYGWHPLQRHGLGPEGREGRRVPLRAAQRAERMGLGATTTVTTATKNKPKPARKTKKGKKNGEAQEENALAAELLKGG